MMIKKYLTPFLTVICTMAILGATSVALKPVEAQNEEKEQQKLMQMLLPDSETFTEEVYEGKDASIRNVFRGETGCIVRTAVNGYADRITIMVGVKNDGSVNGVVIEDMHETWGLGRCAMTDMSFLSQFLDTKGDASLGVDVDALSGATVTSKAVLRAINSAAAFMSGVNSASGATGEAAAAEDATTGATGEAAETPETEDAATGATTESVETEDASSGATTESVETEDAVTGATTESAETEDASSGATTESAETEDASSGATTEE